MYFAPDHIDSSQYVQYFGMIEGVVVAGSVRARASNADEQASCSPRRSPPTGDEQDRRSTPSSARSMIDDLIIFPLVNPGLVLAHASDITGVRYSACCNLELGGLGID